MDTPPGPLVVLPVQDGPGDRSFKKINYKIGDDLKTAMSYVHLHVVTTMFSSYSHRGFYWGIHPRDDEHPRDEATSYKYQPLDVYETEDKKMILIIWYMDDGYPLIEEMTMQFYLTLAPRPAIIHEHVATKHMIEDWEKSASCSCESFWSDM